MVSTRKLVDSLEEHELLERLVERSKPRLPEHAARTSLHYLLSTPFRYPPLRHGSRFGTRAEPSLWYGATRPRTAFAETAYYRLLFLEGTTARLEPLRSELTLYRVPLSTPRGVDLCRGPFEALRKTIASPDAYGATQQLGREMRAGGVEAFRYPSARDIRGGVNTALFSPAAFAAARPDLWESWHLRASRDGVELVKRDFLVQRTWIYPRSDFEVRGRLPWPAP